MRGVLSRRRDELELYRVKDTTFDQPFLLRIVSLANIEVSSADQSTPGLLIPAIRDAEGLREEIRGHVERVRQHRQVRLLEMG